MWFIVPKQVEAYIDPGTGSYAYQLLLAGLFSVVFFVGAALKKIITKFRQKQSKKTSKTK